MNDKVAYSPAEAKLLHNILHSGERTTIPALARKQYAKGREPFNANGVVRATLTGLIRKVDHNREKFRVRKGQRRGPHPTQVWAEPR